MKKILILGATGLIGTALVNELYQNYDLYCLTRGSYQNSRATYIKYDLEKDDIRGVLKAVAPDVIISCTRGNYSAQLKVHKLIGDYSHKYDIRLLYFSTVNVFDGNPTKAMYEDDGPIAQSNYGQFKLDCEHLLNQEAKDNLTILRLPMVFGKASPRVQEIIEGIEHKGEVIVFNNLHITTILDTTVANIVQEILASHLIGIFHLASKDVINHFNFYDRIINGATPLKLERIKDYDDYYLAICSSRKEIKEFEFSNADVIEAIVAFINAKK